MANLNPNATIAEEKLTRYLLIPLAKDDKSQFLAQSGYGLGNWQQLEQDLRAQILSLEATPTNLTRHGQKYVIVGDLTGPNGVTVSVKTIWMVTLDETRFVTLFPHKGRTE
jgi:hypothetical protein